MFDKKREKSKVEKVHVEKVEKVQEKKYIARMQRSATLQRDSTIFRRFNDSKIFNSRDNIIYI